MMGHREKMISGDEHDALRHRAKRLLVWAAGTRKATKAKFNRRARKAAKLQVAQDQADGAA
jgi:hypothetical protein